MVQTLPAEHLTEVSARAPHAGQLEAGDTEAVMVQGPSVSMDTACSSSLVGAHMACTSFLSAECPRALVAGINLTMRAETTAVLSKAGMLAQASWQLSAPHAVMPLSPHSCTADFD